MILLCHNSYMFCKSAILYTDFWLLIIDIEQEILHENVLLSILTCNGRHLVCPPWAQSLYTSPKGTNSYVCVSCAVAFVSCTKNQEWNCAQHGERQGTVCAHGPSHSFLWMSEHCRFTPNFVHGGKTKLSATIISFQYRCF